MSNRHTMSVRKTIQLCLLLILACMEVWQAPFASADTFPTNEQLREVRRIEDPRLSPDGRKVLFRFVDATADGGRGHLWITPTDGGSAQPLTASGLGTDSQGEHGGVFSADGSSVWFLAKRDKHQGLFRLPLSGGEAMAVPVTLPVRVDDILAGDTIASVVSGVPSVMGTRMAVDVQGFRLSPEGTSLAVWARDPQTPGEKALADAKADATLVDHETHRVRLVLMDPRAATAAVRDVDLSGACAACDVQDVEWSPDGQDLLVILAPAHRTGDLGPQNSGWIVHVQGNDTLERLALLPPTVMTAAYSADGRRVYVTAQALADTPPGYPSFYAIELASGQIHDWNEGEAIPAGRPQDLGDGAVLVAGQQGLDAPLLRFDPAERLPSQWSPGVAVVDGVDAHAAGIAFVGSSSGKAPALYFAQHFGEAPRRLDTPSVLDGVATIAARRIEWTFEGRRLQGLLALPSDVSHRVPLIVEVHGGPLGAYSDRYDPFVDFLVGQGWAVLRTNPRGSTGRGPDFAAANRNDLGGGDYRDVMSGVDWVLEHAPVDPTKLALVGYSYGGEMAGFVEGRTRRFKAIVSGAPVIDQFSEYGTEESSWYDRWYFGKPWEHGTDAWRQSPLSGAANAHTPFLLLQGEADVTDPLGQSQEMYRALRQSGVAVELVTYPREDHGGLARGLYGEPSPEPWHGFDARERILRFIHRAFAAP